MNTTSASQTVTLTNTSATDTVTISSSSSSDPAFVDAADTCHASIAPGASCHFLMVFNPKTIASFSAAVTLQVAGVSCAGCSYPSPTFAVTGTGIAQPPIFTPAPAVVSFGNQIVNTTSAQQTVTLTNSNASATVSIGVFTVSDPAYADAGDNCTGESLAPGASCSIKLTFTPTTVKSYAATISFLVNPISCPACAYPGQSVPLTGTGIAQPPIFTPAPAAVSFGNQIVNTTSAQQTVTLTNSNASATVSIGVFTVSDPAYADAGDNCTGESLAPGASCSIKLTFTPTTVKSYAATISFLVNPISCPACTYPSQTFAVTGTGTAQPPIFTPAPAAVSFGNQIVNTTSAQQTVTLTNSSSSATVSIGVFTLSDPAFADAGDNCTGELLAPGASCSIKLTFNPSAVKSYSASISFPVYPVSCPACTYPGESIPLTGTGIAQPPDFSLSPSLLDFGNQIILIPSATQTVTVTNISTTDTLQIAGVSPTVGRYFVNAVGCAGTIAPGASCPVTVYFNPASLGPDNGLLRVNVSSVTCPACTIPTQSIAITGTGIAQPPVLTISPASLNFGNQAIGIPSATQTVTVTNISTTDTLQVTNVVPSVGRMFVNASGCAGPVAPGASCPVQVYFNPAAAGPYNGTLDFTVGDTTCGARGGINCTIKQSIPITGTGIVSAPQISIGSPTLIFSATAFTTSAAQTSTIANSGRGPLLISGISLAGSNPDDYRESDNCGLNLAAGASCTISVTFTPPSVGSYPATVVINDNDPTSPQTITLDGTGVSAPDFVVASSVPSLAVPPGGSAKFAVTVSALSGATIPAVTLSATGLPPGATASFATSSVTPGSTSATTTLTIDTPPALAGTRQSWPGNARSTALPALALLGWFFVPRKQRRRWITLGLLLFASLGGSFALTGCAGGFNLVPPAKTYTVTVTAAVGSVHQTTTVQLTVE